MGGEEGEGRVLLRSRADKATAKQNTASERLRPTGVQEGATGMPVGLHCATQLGKVRSKKYRLIVNHRPWSKRVERSAELLRDRDAAHGRPGSRSLNDLAIAGIEHDVDDLPRAARFREENQIGGL